MNCNTTHYRANSSSVPGDPTARRPFDLARGPLFRTLLLRLAPRAHRLLATLHHIAADGWSLGLFLDELAALYPALAGGASAPASLPSALPIQYADFAAWQTEALAGGVLARELGYWRERLAGLPVLELPTDRPRPAVRDPRGATRALALDAATAEAVARHARQRGVTLFMALLGAFQALLSRLTGEDRIAVGSPVANRRRPEVERLIGFFVNTLVLDARTGDDPAWSELLARVREACLGAYAHQDLPFERLVEELAPSRDRAQNPLVQVVFALEEPLVPRRAGDLSLAPRRSDSGTAKFDLLLTVSPQGDQSGGGGWRLLAEHPTALWERSTIDRLLGHFRTLLAHVATADPATAISALPILSEPERQQLVVEWNDTATARPSAVRLHGLVARQAARVPDAVAVVSGVERLSYGGLMARAHRISALLRSLGIGPERRVGLCVARGPDLIAGVLGILSAGGVYVPLDPSHPRERLEHVLADSGAEILLTESAVARRLGSLARSVLLLDRLDRSQSGDELDSPADSGALDENLAYVIYTSGSTGRPKGIAITHRSAVNMVRWTLSTFTADELGGSLAATSVGFDVSIFEMLAPLAAGGRLVLAASLAALPDLAAAGELRLVTGVPSPMAELVEGGLPAAARTVNLGGEALKPDLVARLYAQPQVERVMNLYGPAENTTYSTCATVPRGASLVPIGRPVANARARVLGPSWAAGEPLPVGAPGELFVAGASLARGYLGQPDLTAERFLPDPLGAPGARMYRTGDRARALADGQLDYLGRLDHQVKLRGVRLELGEIEVQLEELPAVRQAVVALRDDGPEGPRLVGYVVPADPETDVPDLGRELAAALGRRLPAVMVPSAWVILPALPLSPNGKVDRRALPAPSRPAAALGAPGEADGDEANAPRNEMEERLAAIWREVLGRERVGIHESFFEIGGHSLLALRAAFRVSEAFGVHVPLADLFEAPTVAALAARLAAAAGHDALAPLAPAEDEGAGTRARLTSSQRRIWFIDRLEPGGTLYNLQAALRLRGRLDADALAKALHEIVRRHEPLRTIYPDDAERREPVQEVLPAPHRPLLAGLSLAALPAERRQGALIAVLAAEIERPFDLRRGPVVRFLLVDLGGSEHVLAATFHHIATDGWSLGIFARELAALYGAFAAGRPSPLAELGLRYRDLVAEERRALASPLASAALAGSIDHWRRQLAGIPALELPGDRPRPPLPGPRAVSLPVAIPGDLGVALRALGRDVGATPFMVLYAGFAALLARWTGQDDFGVGVPASGRNRPEAREMIGLFINTLVLRAPLAGDPTFRDLLPRVRATTVAAQAHQEVPFDRLVDELEVPRGTGLTPLFQALFGYLSDPAPALAMPGLEATLLDLAPRVTEFDLTLELHEWREPVEHLGGALTLRADLFDESTAARLRGHLLTLLAGIADDPGRQLSDLPLLDAAERRQLAEWSGEPVPWRNGLLYWPFEERAALAPDAPAVLAPEGTISYADLEARANRLARHLLALPLGPEARVAVCLERSLDLYVAFLAVLKAGGVYLPLDPRYPPQRMREVLADSGAVALVSRESAASRLPLDGLGLARVLVDRDAAEIAGRSDERPALAIDPRSLAYIYYTSGSTGRPKGVAVPHGAAAVHLEMMREAYGLRPGDRVLQFASPGFDVSFEQILNTLSAGATLVVPDDALLDPHELTRRIGERGLTYVELPTAYWHRWASDPGEVASTAPLRLVVVGSEEMLPASVRTWTRSPFAAIRLLNVYGPTEAVCTTTFHEIRPEDGLRSVPIGRSVSGRSSWVLDRAGNPQPPGVPGELVHGGPLARGYLDRPELTAERFVPDPFAADAAEPGARLYRTGDRARFRTDGALEFLGRIDGQVKIRGFRVELGEVETALSRHPAVAEAAVEAVAGPGGDRRLAAWIVARPAPPGAGAADLPALLRADLRASLPEYMVPTAWKVLPALPLNAHGKVDRSALPPPEADVAREGAAPSTPEEEILAGLFAELLERGEPVGADDGFFDLGGHSLLATQLASRLRAVFGIELPLAAIFEEPTPAGLARRLEALRRSGLGVDAGAPPLVREGGPTTATAPLSFSQQRLWFLHQLEPGDAYHVPGALRLRGEPREDVLARALGEIVRRHESLRTVFRDDGKELGKEPVQVVLPPPAPALDAAAIPIADLTGLDPAHREEERERLLAGEATRPFDLAAGPLVRVLLLRLAPGDRLLSVVMHHIISDAWSLGPLLRELSALYSAFAAGEPSPLPALPLQYPDFARWQRRWLAGEALAREIAHWRRALAGSLDPLALPYDRPPAPGLSGFSAAAGRQPYEIAPALYGAMTALARREGWTAFMALLAGFQALLARYGGREDVVVGSPIANRNRLELEGLIGFLTNTLALRLDLAGDPSFRELGRRVRDVALAAYAHQDLPFEKLVEEMAPDRHLGRNPLFQTMLVLQRLPAPPALPGVEVEMLDGAKVSAKFDLTLTLVEETGRAAGWLEYACALFDEATVDRLLVHLTTLLSHALAAPDRPLSELPLLSAPERDELAAWTRPRAAAAPPILVHEGVAAQAARTPEALAVVFGDESATYAELLARARRLARRLRALGVGPDVPVGLLLERSLDAMVAVLAVLEAGGAYLPLDAGYPPERLRAMLADAGAPVLLAHGVTASALAAVVPPGTTTVVRVDDPALDAASAAPLPSAGTTPDHLAYVIYTSGSTGRPKGVAMTHGGIAAMLRWQLRTSSTGAGRTLQFTSLSFDVSFQEIFSTWWAGGTLVLVSEDARRDPPALVALLAEARVERLFLPFVALQQVAAAALAEGGGTGGFPADLREVMSAGEQLHVTPQVAELFARLPGAALHNHYGPSETHAVTWLSLAGDPARWPELPAIGSPVDHARVHLLDAWLQPVPVGVAGEVWVGGGGLARGYFGRPDLTAERWLPDPFDWAAGWRPGDRVYRTGDLARRRPDGVLEFLGRSDAQVKIRGHRVELSEVEAALARHPAVAQAAVATRGEGAGARRLAAYVVFREDGPPADFGELRAFLAESLPDPMVPTVWARIAALPLTATGKLDRRALAHLEPEETAGGDLAFVAPRTPAETLLSGIWREVLGVARVGVHDDFFALGGHSLLATQVASRVRRSFGVELPLRRLFLAPTVAGLAAAIEEIAETAEINTIAAAGGVPAPPPPILPVSRGGDLPLSFAQERMWFLERLQPGAAYNLPLALRALRSESRLDPARLERALTGVVRRHEVLRTVLVERDGTPAQAIQPATEVPLPRVDLAALPASRREAEARRLAREDAARPFDLVRGPLLRARLVELAPDESLFLLAMHHVVADGWSLGILVHEVKALYAGDELPALPVQYADFAVWQRRWLAGETLERQLAWWRERLQGAPEALDLPADFPRPALLSQRGADHRFALPAPLAGRLAEIAAREGATPFMVLAAGLFALLGRLSGARDLTLGVPIANRNRLETEGLIGFFVNTLVLRADLARAATFGDLLRAVREASVGAFAHQDLPFERLVDELRPSRDLARSPLFAVALVLQGRQIPGAELGGVRLVHEDLPGEIAKFDLSFAFDTTGGDGEAIGGSLEYATDLFAATTAMRMARGFGALLGSLLADPAAPLAAAPLLAEAERHQLLAEWNDTAADYGRELTVLDLLAASTGRRPDAIAAVCEGASLTYGGLASRAAWIARRLEASGAGPATPVAIWMERSLDMVAAVVGALSTGAGYVPIDPAWPAGRAAAVLARIGESVVLVDGMQLPAAHDLRLPAAGIVRADDLDIDLDSAPDARATAQVTGHHRELPSASLAYLIHTSGSTGEPKGIGVQHRPLVNHFGWVNGTFGIGPGDRLLAVNSLGFDLSVYDLLGTLAAGGTVQVAPEAALRDPARLARLLLEEPVTVWHSAPAALLQLVPFFPAANGDGAIPPLRLAMLAGDWIPLGLPAEIRAAFPRARVLNLGGATETSVWSNVYEIDGVDPRWANVPYGRPIANARYHVLDENLAPCPIGVTGDMYIGGEVLSLGYVGRPEATAERFVPDPYASDAAAPGTRLWATGDRGRYLADGNLEFLGRVDHQVKVRGYRIELGEIEMALARHPGVREAAVLAREDTPGEPRLVAYVVPSGHPPEPDALRAFLLASLPEYMVPWAFVEMEGLPVTGNGKLDRAALPAPGVPGTAGAAVAYVAPRNDREREIAAVWREVLGVERIGVQESFFAAGGSSLLMARLQSKLGRALGRNIPFVELFKHPTIESLARSLDEAEGEPAGAEGGESAGERGRPAERARARSAARREAMRQVQQRGRRRPGEGRGERHES